MVEGIDEVIIRGAVVASDVPPAAQGEVHLREVLVGDGFFEGLKAGGSHRSSPSFDSSQSSSSKLSATVRHGRS